VTDKAEILKPETETQLNQTIDQLEAKNGAEMAVVTVQETAPAASPKEFATKLFNYWGIGKKGKDNGVLFLISVKDRRVEIETGYGVEGILPDAKVGNIIETQITPRFKQRDFDGGTVAGTRALVAILEGTSSDTGTDLGWIWFVGESLSLLVLVLAIGSVIYGKKHPPIFLRSEGHYRLKEEDKYSIYCLQCQEPMKKVDKTVCQSRLSQAEKVAQQLGSVRFEGWECSKCSQTPKERGFAIIGYIANSDQFKECPTCRELTLTRQIKTVLREPTWNQTGKQVVVQECHCCSSYEEFEEILPCLPIPANAIMLEPTGRSHTFLDESQRPTHCADCHFPMQKVDPQSVQLYLSQPEKEAQELGNVKFFMGWRCPNCSQGGKIHIRAFALSSSHNLECPQCLSFTLIRTKKILQPPTKRSEGKRLIVDECQSCSYRKEFKETIPVLPTFPSSPSRGHSSGGNGLSNWVSGGSSSFGGGISGGGGSFGGGSSGGGGAGGSW
jgi:uncharacterized protein